ncbi:HAMP domain-containing sensor histidine kinase [Romboutsia sp. 1001216sp1]|uniref:sensor histidine kinase n=1 Tax=unclassified Romboutsia TaxID=2626894 RepID=UPI0018AAF0D8|nr:MULTISPECIES: HAMP domain-containing sensor histidine kinase [unclassified Romboutsia]MDB8792670.1 HAMP domain-containing sensor histidine kinase [Romboutsia sp. 1001216sp1]MDB8796163.1 HAMP domain-containing sensor histidine kinase [Romboutsia sp. 1001216sp1]MDB8798156.1 HAMP domain-containing sensor histidine kinase [Romboutsia sp. 1001216sp1]
MTKFKKIIYILTVILMTQMFISKIHAKSTKDASFNVLVLNSYHQGHYWESNITMGLKNYISNNNESNINFKVEYLDFRVNHNKEYIKSLKDMLSKKYPKGSIDVIYTVNDEAYEVFKNEVKNINSNFYKLPLLFSGVDNNLEETSKEKENMAGIYHRDDTLDLMILMKDLTPKARYINIITEESGYGYSIYKEVTRIVDRYLKDQVKIRHIKSNYLEDITKELSEIKNSEDTINVIGGEFQYENSGKYIAPIEVISTIKNYSSAPIYSNDQTYMNAGILGGSMDIGQEQGSIIGEMIIKLKSGEKIENIKSVPEPKVKSYVDYNSIYEYNINPFSVIKDVVVLNKDPFELLIPTWMKGVLIFLQIISIIIIIGIIIIFIRFRNDKLKRIEIQKRAKEREKLKSDFIVNLSHELRTPINIILGTTKVLEKSLEKGNLDKDYILSKLENVDKNAYRLLKISNNIIDMTKAESGMLKLNLENCNIVCVVEDIFESSIDFARRKNIDMVFDTECEEVKVAIDIFQIQRVILNLLSNAIKFTPENGVISVYIYKEKENVVIEVKDNGVGISKEKVDYIFHRFYQVDNLYTRHNEGSGIGLCIVKEIIDIHDGKIQIESEINKGSTFKICLPRHLKVNEMQNEGSSIKDINKIVDLEMSDVY